MHYFGRESQNMPTTVESNPISVEEIQKRGSNKVQT